MESLEVRKNKEIVEEASDKENLKKCLNYYRMSQFSIIAFLIDKEIDPKEFLEFQEKMFNTLEYSPVNNKVAKTMIRKMPNQFVLNQAIKFLVNTLQTFHKLKYFTLQIGKKSAILELKKCLVRKKFRKYATKMNLEIEDDLACYLCQKMFENATDFGIETEIEPTKEGCIVRFKKN